MDTQTRHRKLKQSNDQAHLTQTTSATQPTILGRSGAETFSGTVLFKTEKEVVIIIIYSIFGLQYF
ncbi:hypothetical protein KBT16_32855 [Nostoc sp. CCCryo 231-06]|nr:hypothetical protein [Nostoc sp. CCCryo 231-06]